MRLSRQPTTIIISRRNWSAARTHMVGEAKHVFLWPRTINLISMRPERARAKGAASGNEIYVSDLVERIAWVAAVAVLVVPALSGLAYYVGVALCYQAAMP